MLVTTAAPNAMESELKSLQSKIMDLETKLCFTQNEEEDYMKSPVNDNAALRSLAQEVESIKSGRKQLAFDQSADKNSDI